MNTPVSLLLKAARQLAFSRSRGGRGPRFLSAPHWRKRGPGVVVGIRARASIANSTRRRSKSSKRFRSLNTSHVWPRRSTPARKKRRLSSTRYSKRRRRLPKRCSISVPQNILQILPRVLEPVNPFPPAISPILLNMCAPRRRGAGPTTPSIRGIYSLHVRRRQSVSTVPKHNKTKRI